MESSQSWQAALHMCRAAGIDALPLGVPLTEAAWNLLADAKPPLAVRTFAEGWTQQAPDPWEALLRSAATVNPQVAEVWSEYGSVACLRAIVARTEYAAAAYGQTLDWSSPDQWAYLLQLRQPQGERAHLLLHPPAAAADTARAEHVLGVPLPPSYKDFLALTNGLGLGPTEECYIAGAGPSRAKWKPVVFNAWMECAGQHEVAALWREFQGAYAVERIRDRERAQDRFLSDETVLVPFAFTSVIWCFDRARPDDSGEYPVVLWDTEVRQARDGYADFAAWFADQMETLTRRSA